MAKVINLNSPTAGYLKEVDSAVKSLTRFEGKLFSMMLNLAVNGAWKEWNDNVPEGEVVEFHPEMFAEIDDTRIQLLKEVYDKLTIAKEELKRLKKAAGPGMHRVPLSDSKTKR